MSTDTHWLSDALAALSTRVAAADRHALRRAVADLVVRLGGVSGVDAAFAAHEGLLVEGVGPRPDLEALAALGHATMLPGREAASSLALGPLRQMVIVGADRKVALFQVGDFVVGVRAAATVHLGARLAAAPD